MVKKRSRPPHFDRTRPRLTFGAAYAAVSRNPGQVYHTTGNGTPFTATAQHALRGTHRGQRVIVFRSDGVERARAYECCWTHRTNCNCTYVDCYVLAL
jgi:hypothetical protein